MRAGCTIRRNTRIMDLSLFAKNIYSLSHRLTLKVGAVAPDNVIIMGRNTTSLALKTDKTDS